MKNMLEEKNKITALIGILYMEIYSTNNKMSLLLKLNRIVTNDL